MTPKLIAVVGPSGAGKDTLMMAAAKARPDLVILRRVITRPEAAGSEDFEGVTETEFATRKATGAFALDWQAHGLSYGIPKDQILGAGPVLFNGSRVMLPTARARFPDLYIILVTAPTAILAARLADRGRESAADIAARLERAGFVLPAGITATTVLNDGPLDQGVARFLAALQRERA
jgi:ribose 1,5-bisphosphokinase